MRTEQQEQVQSATTWLIPWRIEGVAKVRAVSATEAKLKFMQIHQEDIAAEGELSTDDAKSEG